MPKTTLKALRQRFRRLQLRAKGVVIYHHTAFSNVEFNGPAIIEPYCRLVGIPRIKIGANFYMNAGCHLLGEISIGNDVMIGPKVVMWGRDHGLELHSPMRSQPHQSSPIVIGDDVWISANVTIVKGVTIGSGAVIGAGAVVTRNIPPFAVAVGNPARVIRQRS